MSDVLHLSIHDAEVDQRHRRSGLGAKLDLLVEVSGQLVLLELSDRQDGTGLRHAIAREDVDATLHRRLGQRFGQRRAADHHFQLGKIDVLAVGRRQQHLQDRRNTMAKRHALGLDQAQEKFGLIPAGIDLFDARCGRGIGQSPAVDVKHRRDRHVHVFAVKPPLPPRRAEPDQIDQRVKHKLAMAEVDALGRAGGSRGVKHRRAGVLVEILEREIRGTLCQHRLIMADGLDRAVRKHAVIRHQNDAFDGFKLPLQLLDQRKKLDVHQQELGTRVIEREQNLLGRQPDIDGLKRGAEHRDCKIAFQIAVAIPIQYADDIAATDALRSETTRKPPDSFAQIAIGVAAEIAVDDLLIGRLCHRRVKKVLDQQRVLVGRGRMLDQEIRH